MADSDSTRWSRPDAAAMLAESLQRIEACLDLLASGYKAEYHLPPRREEDACIMGFWDYDDRIHDGLSAGLTIVGSDYDYLDHYKVIKDLPIEGLTADQLSTRLTFLIRGERFCDGCIAGAVFSGELEALLVRTTQISPRV